MGREVMGEPCVKYVAVLLGLAAAGRETENGTFRVFPLFHKTPLRSPVSSLKDSSSGPQDPY